MNELFAEVRSTLHSAPSPATWEALCALLEQGAGDPRTGELLTYAEGVLREWPDALREAPLRWLEQERWPLLRLARLLDLTDDELLLGPALQANALSALREIRLHTRLGPDLDGARARSLRSAYTTPDLRVWRHASAGMLTPSPLHADQSPWCYMHSHDAHRPGVHTTEQCGPLDRYTETDQVLCLEWRSGSDARDEPPPHITLNRRFAALGRAPRHTNTITILSPVLSRTHTVLYQLGDRWYARDMLTTNGTYLNNTLIHRGASRLRVGDEVAFASFIYSVVSC